MTQGELARILGLSPALISHWEAARRDVSVASLLALSRALEIDVRELLAEPRSQFDTANQLNEVFRLLGVRAKSGTVPRAIGVADLDSPRELRPRPRASNPVEAALELIGKKDTPPIDVHSLARACGIRVTVEPWTPDNRLRGFLSLGPPPMLVAQKGLPSTELRFTIARALGHWSLGDAAPYFDLGPDAEGQQVLPMNPESWARVNQFAVTLLMPAPALRREALRSSSLFQLARTFAVSEVSIALRMQSLGLNPLY